MKLKDQLAKQKRKFNKRPPARTGQSIAQQKYTRIHKLELPDMSAAYRKGMVIDESDATRFDFFDESNWNRVLNLVDDRKKIELLAYAAMMTDICDDLGEKWDPTTGPWEYTDSIRMQAAYEAGWFPPKERTPLWFACLGRCHHAVTWLFALAVILYPNTPWTIVRCSDSGALSEDELKFAETVTNAHSTVVGPVNGKPMFFDLLWWRRPLGDLVKVFNRMDQCFYLELKAMETGPDSASLDIKPITRN